MRFSISRFHFSPFRRRLLLLAALAGGLHAPPALHAGPAAPATPPAAGGDHDEPVLLENLVVTATPYTRGQAGIAQPSSVLAGRRLLLNQNTSLGELLSGETGVASTWFGPGASRPVIRGLGGDRVRVLANSIGTIDASVTSPDHAVSLDPLLVERVEIVRGPAALLYGGNAVGGVVNVIDHRIHTTLPDAPLNGRAEGRVNSVNDEESAGAVLEGRAGRLAWHLDGYRRSTGDTRIPGHAKSGRIRAEEAREHEEEHGHEDHAHEGEGGDVFGRIANTAITTDGGAAGLSYIGPRGYIGVSYSGHNSLYGVPPGAHVHEHEEGGDDDDHEAGEHEEGGVRIDLRQRRLDLQAACTGPLGIFREARLKLGLAKYRHQELEGDEIGTVFKNKGHDGRFELLHNALGPVTGALGLQTSRGDFEARGEEAFVPSSRTDSGALFIFEEAAFSTLTLQLGARADYQKIKLRDGSGVSRDDTTASASAGLVWDAAPGWTLGASLAATTRQPNAQELYADGPHIGTQAYETGDPLLSNEHALSLDLTLRKRAGPVTGALTFFASRFDGYIHENPTGAERDGLDVYHHAQHDARFYGVELETIFHLLHSRARHSGAGHSGARHSNAQYSGANHSGVSHSGVSHSGTGHSGVRHSGASHSNAQYSEVQYSGAQYSETRQLDLTLSGDLARAKNTDTGAILPRITPARLRAALDWVRGPISLGAEARFVARQTRTAPNETATPGHTLLNASAACRFALARAQCEVFLRGTNLANAEARPHTSFLKDYAPLPGRSLTAGLRMSF
ncbi:MAG: TonB-dependent receptor [Opitutaceae bacterium]|jgi:iron complex outermembrane receptor protein|nr:TonB-dependent receptor [Opitutaceae bacterium]